MLTGGGTGGGRGEGYIYVSRSAQLWGRRVRERRCGEGGYMLIGGERRGLHVNCRVHRFCQCVPSCHIIKFVKGGASLQFTIVHDDLDHMIYCQHQKVAVSCRKEPPAHQFASLSDWTLKLQPSKEGYW